MLRACIRGRTKQRQLRFMFISSKTTRLQAEAKEGESENHERLYEDGKREESYTQRDTETGEFVCTQPHEQLATSWTTHVQTCSGNNARSKTATIVDSEFNARRGRRLPAKPLETRLTECMVSLDWLIVYSGN